MTDPLGKNRLIGRNRFNLAAGARVLYTAEDQHTCLFELQAFAWPAQAISIVPVEFQLNSVVDLRDKKILQSLQTDETEISFNFRSVTPGFPPTATQELGEAIALSARIDGLLFPSFAVPAAFGVKQNLAIIEAGVSYLRSRVEAKDPLSNILHKLP